MKIIKKLLSGAEQLESGDLESKATTRCLEFENSFNDPGSSKAHRRRSSDTQSSDSDREGSTHASKGDGPDNEKESDPRAALRAIQGSCLYQIEVPDIAGPNTYGNLYRILSAQGSAPFFVNLAIAAPCLSAPHHSSLLRKV